MTFKEAFAAARAAGLPDFEYNGKRYTTQLAGESKKRKPENKVKKEIEALIPNLPKTEDLDYSGTDIPYKYRGLGDVEFRADIEDDVKSSPIAIAALADIEKRTGGDYGKLLDFTSPGVFKNLKGEDVQVGRTYKSEDGKDDFINKGLSQSPGAYFYPSYREDVAELEGRDIDDIPAIILNPDKVDTFGPGTYGNKPKISAGQVLRHELDHYGIDSLLNVGSEDHYFEDPNSNIAVDAFLDDYYGMGHDNIPHEHDMIDPLDVIQGKEKGFDMVDLGFAKPEDAKSAELLKYETPVSVRENPAVYFRKRLDQLALDRLAELGIPKTPQNIIEIQKAPSFLDRIKTLFSKDFMKTNAPFVPRKQPRFEYKQGGIASIRKA
mgnify:CR=1 FL=1